MEKVKVIAFDADDTLWINEPYYREAETAFCNLMENYLPHKEISEELFKIEIKNLEKYGYGTKGFMLSMVETALKISEKKISADAIEEIMNLGKSLLEKPIELLDDVERLLIHLKNNYRLILATKGDLTDQQRKLKQSGLHFHFHHIEIMSEKKEENYLHLLQRLNIRAEEFLMVGNSLKSDILPVISIGAKAVHVPYHITWQHETTDSTNFSGQYFEIKKLAELVDILSLK